MGMSAELRVDKDRSLNCECVISLELSSTKSNACLFLLLGKEDLLLGAWDLKRTFLKQDGAGPCHDCGVDRRGISVVHAGADAGRSALG